VKSKRAKQANDIYSAEINNLIKAHHSMEPARGLLMTVMITITSI